MTFKTGSITDANPGQQLYALIETEAFILGWTLVDSVTIGSNTHKVLKSAAVGNARNLDFFIDISFNTAGTGNFGMAPFEGYNATTHFATRGPVSINNATVEQTFYSRYGATADVLEGSNWNNGSNYSGIRIATVSSPFLYAFSVTRNRIIVFCSNDNAFLYCGFFTPTLDHIAYAGSALFPLVVAKVGATGIAGTNNSVAGVSMMLTRVPKLASLNWSANYMMTPVNQVTQGVVGQGVSLTTGKIIVSPIIILFNTTPILTVGASSQSFVGTLDGLVQGFVLSTATRLDTVTIASDTWYCLTPSGNNTSFMQGV